MKKILLATAVFLMLFTQFSYAEGFNLTVGTKEANKGETVTVDLTISGNTGIIAALFELEYDKERLILVKAEDKGLIKGAIFSQTYEKYPYIMLWNSSSAKNFTANGTLATLTFKVSDSAISGDAFIKVSYNPENVYDADLNNVDVRIKSGVIKVSGISPKEEEPSPPQKEESTLLPPKEESSSKGKGHSSPSVSVQKEQSVVKEEKRKQFTDVKEDDWYYDASVYVTQKGLMKGTSDTAFSPDVPLTRAMLVTILYRNDGSPSVESNAVFDDTAPDMYYFNAVQWAKGNGIVSGVTEKLFSPDTSITREQLVSILYRYARYKNYNISVKANLSLYDDFKNISDYAILPMQYAISKGLIKGNTDKTLNPLGNATRAQTAVILYRFLET